MKFRLKLIVLVILSALVLSCVFCACDTDASLLKRNDERYSKQITATATYGDRVSVVDVNELYTSFYRYYSYIYQYYSYGYISAEQFQQYMSNLDKTFADSNESLAKNALYVLRNIDELYKLGLNMTDKADKVQNMIANSTAKKSYDFSKVDQLEQYYVDRCNEIQSILEVVCADYSYINNAIHTANEQIESLFNDYVEEVRDEFDALNEDKDETPKGFYDIIIVSKPNRLVYEVNSNATINLAGMKVVAKYSDSEDVVIPNRFLSVTGFSASKAAEDQEITVTYGDYSKTFTVDVVTALTDRTQPTEEADEHDHDKEIADATNNNTEILAKFVFEINEDDYIKDNMTDEEYKEATRELKIARTAMKRTIDQLEKNYRTYDYYLYVAYGDQVNSAYTQKITSTVKVTYQDVLAKYDELVEKALSAYKTDKYNKSTLENSPFETIVHKNYESKDFGYYYVSHVLFQFDEDTQKKIDDFKAEKVANDEVIKAYSESLVGEITVWESNLDYKADATCEEEDCDCPRCSNYNGESITFDTLKKWFGLDSSVENDPCVSFDEAGNRTVNCTCEACPAKRYVGVLNAMDVVNALNEEIAACGDDLAKKNEVMHNYIYRYNMDPGMFSNLEKDLDYLMTPEDIDSGMVAEYEAKCEELAANGVGSYGYVVSPDYGVFFIMVTGKVGDVNEENVTKIDDDYVKLDLNYITNKYAELEEGENPVVSDGTNEITFEAGSIGYYIWQDLYSEAQSIELAKAKKAFENSIDDNSLEYFPKTYKDLIKNIEKGNA